MEGSPHPGHGISESSEQMTGIEPAQRAWEACILPLNYICIKGCPREVGKNCDIPEPVTGIEPAP